MQEVFTNGSNSDSRKILIIIDEENIEFFFEEQYNRQKLWIEELENKFRLGEAEEPSDEERQVYGFYWINSMDWHKHKTDHLDRPDNWHTHMKEKMWFTKEMQDFMDENTIDLK